MTTLKARFNTKYKQPITQSNSIQDIANLTGNSVSFLERIYNDTIKYPCTYDYNELNKKIPLPAFAMCRVYKFSLK
tara:strand:- start:77 stop:304 length:228 start_codon:yes stop_codon:yes gene_type:complete